jgi:hypothetical protein
MPALNEGKGSGKPQGLAQLEAQKLQIAAELARIVRASVARKDTHFPAFHGCIDWHSAVHGTWALSAYARMAGDRQDEALLAATLCPASIAAERAYLRSHAEFEMPYGRAWFLRLAIEHDRAFSSDALRPMAGEVLASMLGYYARVTPDPNRGSYASDSWALINMLDYAEWAGDGAALQQIRALASANFLQRESRCDYTLETGNFMAVGTNWAWLASRLLARDAFDRWADTFFRQSGMPQAVTQPVGWHHHGLNFSRAWGLWQLFAVSASANAKAAYLAAYVALFRAAYDTLALWRGSYRGVGHWVPQFGMLALQPLFGEGRP